MSKVGAFELMRVWAALTGIALALGYFATLWVGKAPNAMLPLLVTAIGGFELALTGQDFLIKHRRRQR